MWMNLLLSLMLGDIIGFVGVGVVVGAGGAGGGSVLLCVCILISIPLPLVIVSCLAPEISKCVMFTTKNEKQSRFFNDCVE